MGRNWVWRGLALAATAGCAQPAFAQDRTDDNAVTQAEDAFGFSVGRESIGIYGPGNARGFSPTAAGNVRIDGLYFDPAFGLQNILVDSTAIKVGLSAQGYPFVAPSGIVDQRLRRPDQKAGGSVIANIDSWGGAGVELDASLPINDKLAVRIGLSPGSTEFPNGTDNYNHGESLILRWRPASNVEIMPFWSRFDDYDDEIGTFYLPARD
jgi:iron complex outermembrane receptor protein